MADADPAHRLAAAVEEAWPRQVAWLQELVRFQSRRGEEGPCQDWLAGEFAARGWSVDRYTLAEVSMAGEPGFSPVMDTDYASAVQVVATVPSRAEGGRSLILQGHVDVVPEGPGAFWTTPPYEPLIRDGWMQGRGAADMKAGVSAIVFALDAIRQAGFAPAAEVFVQTVTEEESTGNGALSTLARGYRADAVLIPEPSGNTLTRAAVGALWFRLKVRGAPVHVANSRAGANAIMSTFRILEALERLTARQNEAARAHPWFGSSPDPIKFNPGAIRGGDWPSSTPAWCEVDCRIGLLPGTSIEEVRRAVVDTVASVARACASLAGEPEIVWNGFLADGYVQEPGSEGEGLLAAAHLSAFGSPMGERRSTGVNDTRFYTLYHGMTGLCYGPTGRGIHGFDEAVELDSVKRITTAITLFVADWCGLRPL